MTPWAIDASQMTKIEEKNLVITPSIKEFLYPDDRDDIFYVVAPKGIGKSLFLIYKRQLYDLKYKNAEDDTREELYLIPKDLLVDKCLDITRYTLTKEKIEILSDHSNNKQIWKFCISISIIKNIEKFHSYKYLQDLIKSKNELIVKGAFSKDIKDLIDNQNSITPGDIFNEVLNLTYNEIMDIINHQNRVSEIIRNNIRSGVAVFIDNVDQSFEDYLRSDDVHYYLYRSIWYTSQIGLIFAVHELHEINSHIKIFVSIRKEAFQKMRGVGSLGFQIRGRTLDIAYTTIQLKDIFYKNIQNTKDDLLVVSAAKKRNPIYALFGFENNEIETLNGINEDIFSYVHRHTLKRPRDLMEMGNRIVEIDIKERNDENIKNAVNSAAYEIFRDFMAEIRPFININFNILFSLIHSNVLSRDEIKDICGKYNQKYGCVDDECDVCDRTHVFCELWNIGLLGCVVRDLINKDKFIQQFMQIGDRDYQERMLPYSNYYLTHPALIGHIREANLRNRSEFNPMSDLIVGDGYSWKSPFMNSNEIDREIGENESTNQIKKNVNIF